MSDLDAQRNLMRSLQRRLSYIERRFANPDVLDIHNERIEGEALRWALAIVQTHMDPS